MKQFIRAERTGNWQNHLMVVRQMLNLFSATTHFQYAKSARLYLQLMDELPIDFPWLYNLFQQGYYTIRKSDRFWAGLWTDLVIEQSLMRTAKSRGGGVNQSLRNDRVGTFIVGVIRTQMCLCLISS